MGIHKTIKRALLMLDFLEVEHAGM
jgi:hypothetical protein